MSEHKRGEERIMRVTEIDGERTSWVDEGELHDCGTCWAWWFCGGEREKAERWLGSDITREECDEARRCE